jgi:hypothetical protein
MRGDMQASLSAGDPCVSASLTVQLPHVFLRSVHRVIVPETAIDFVRLMTSSYVDALSE